VNIWDIDTLFLFIAFVIPGFISIKVYDLIVPTDSADSAKKIVDAIAYSCINYALLLWPITSIESSNLAAAHPNLHRLFYVLVLFVFPVIWVFIWRLIRTMELFQRNAPHPTGKPWDFVFSQRQCFWIIVTLKNGDQVAGKFAGNSFSSSHPANEQLFLEETWVMNDDGGFERPRTNTAGILILSGEILTVELFKY